MDRHTASDAVDAGLVVANEVARHVPIAEVTVVLGTVTEIVKFVKDTIETVLENKEACKRILSSVHDLDLIHRELMHTLQKDNLPESCSHGFKKLCNSLQTCKETCEKYKEMKMRKYVNASYYQKKLQIIENELNSTIHYLQLALQVGMMYKQKEQRKAQHEIMRRIANIHEGVYLNPYENAQIPFQPERPCAAKLNATKIIISWIDVQNKKHSIVRYEVVLDSGIEQLFSFPITQLIPQGVIVKRCDTNNGGFHYEETDFNTEETPPNESTGLKYSVCFCPPILSKGQLYEVRVRAVNGKGSSEWSDEYLLRYNTCYPKQPEILALDAICPNEVKIEAKVYEPENSINEVIVANANIDDPTATTWNTRIISENLNHTTKHLLEKSSTITFIIDNLDPSNYRFKIAVRNRHGLSPWSFSEDISYEEFPPGAPTNLHFIEGESATNSLFLTWEKPLANPSGVHEYRIHYREDKNRKKWTTEVIPKAVDVYEARNLKPDQKYIFRLESVNQMGKGDVSETKGQLKKETRKLTNAETKEPIPRSRQTVYRTIKPTCYEPEELSQQEYEDDYINNSDSSDSEYLLDIEEHEDQQELP